MERPSSALARVVDGYFLLLKVAVALLLAGMVVLVFGNVVLRYVFNSGIAVSEEMSRWLFVWMVFLGAIVGLREHAHLGIDSLIRLLSPAGRKACYAASHVLMIYASVLLTIGSWKQTLLNWDTTAPASNLSVGIFYLSGVVFGVSAIAILTVELFWLVTGKLKADELIAVSESEDRA